MKMTDEEKKAIEILKELKNNEYGELLNCWDQGDEAKKSINVVLNLISKYQKILDSFETECRRNLATFRTIRKTEKRDVDLFNQGQEYKCCQFLNLLDGEENWQFEGKLFDKVDEEVKKLKQEAKDE